METGTIDLCQRCKGACCEAIALDGQEPLTEELLEGRTLRKSPNRLWLNCRCRHLQDGRCTIYQDRPELCKRFEMGGSQCLDTIQALRPALFMALQSTC